MVYLVLYPASHLYYTVKHGLVSLKTLFSIRKHCYYFNVFIAVGNVDYAGLADVVYGLRLICHLIQDESASSSISISQEINTCIRRRDGMYSASEVVSVETD